MEYTQLLIERAGRVATVTLNRPERMNPLSPRMLREYTSALHELNADPSVGAIVVTGAGRAFCAGADIGGWQDELDQGGREMNAPRESDASENWLEFMASCKPIVGAINGASIGAGMTLTLPFDVRVASEQAKFSMRFVKMGVTPEIGSTMLLTQLVGFGNALDLMLSGKTIDAQEALRIRLVNRVASPERLLEEAMAVAAEMASNPAAGVMAIKRMAWAHLHSADFVSILNREAVEFGAAMQRPDFKEAVAAFLEKRKPEFNRV